MSDQTLIFAIFAALVVMLVWGRIRYDLVAFSALIAGAALGVVPSDHVFSGFGHSAVVIIALVLIVSRGLSASGAVELIASRLIASERPVPFHIAVFATFGAALSGVINNVAALALLMPLDIEAAKKAKRSVGPTLMPLSFATILGGMITLIGTPPNIVISEYRTDTLGEPFRMFDFAPVGLAVAITGILFVALVGWRFLPSRETYLEDAALSPKDRFVAELLVGEQNPEKPVEVQDLYPQSDEADVHIVGLIRNGRRRPGLGRHETLKEGDILLVEGEPKSLEVFSGQTGLSFEGTEKHESGIISDGLTLVEAIVPDGSRVQNRNAHDLRLLENHSVTLLGVSREGRRVLDRVAFLNIRAGDVVLLLGTPERVEAAIDWMGVLPLEGRKTEVIQRQKAGASIGIFLLAVGLAVLGYLPLSIALAAAVIGFIALGLVTGREVYNSVEWKVIVLLASLIPLADAFERSGGADLIAGLILDLTGNYPSWATLAVLMIVTMTMSDFLNNVATTLIAAPIAMSIASTSDQNPDTYLMAVAVAASCAFLTPIGHKNNTIILGPGGYRFGDFWRMGLPLEVFVVIVAVPALMVFWPL